MQIAAARGPSWLRTPLTVLAGAYLLSLFLMGAAPKLPQGLLPATARYFTQVACLFPHAARMTIDYRLEVWQCDARQFEEIEPRLHFPIHPDDKENRFHRVGHFYRRHRQVMRALERYVVQREQARQPEVAVGGIRVSSLRIPFPALGEPAPRWERRALESYPAEQRRAWYYTPTSRRASFCAGADPDAPGQVRASGAMP